MTADELWLTGEKSIILRTSAGPAFLPQLAGAVNAQKQFVLTLNTPAEGTYQIETTPVLPNDAWTPVQTLSNILGVVNWTNSNAEGTKFYRAVRQ